MQAPEEGRDLRHVIGYDGVVSWSSTAIPIAFSLFGLDETRSARTDLIDSSTSLDSSIAGGWL